MGATGLSTQVTVGEETGYGVTAATLTRGFEVRSEGIEDAIERIESESLRAGKRLESYWRENRKGAGGDLEMEHLDKGFALLWKHALGAVSSATPVGGTLTREHTCTLGPINGKSLSTQVGRPDTSGAINPFTYVGGKVAEAELGVDVDGLALLTLTMDYMNGLTPATPAAKGGPGPALAAAVYPTGASPFAFLDALINVGGVATDLTSVTCHITNNLKDDRYFLRRSSFKKEPLEETSPREITFELPQEFTGMAAYNRFVNGTEAAITVSLLGTTAIEGALFPELLLTAPRCRFDGGTPTAGGEDVIEQPQTAMVLMPAAGEPFTALLRNTDTAP